MVGLVLDCESLAKDERMGRRGQDAPFPFDHFFFCFFPPVAAGACLGVNDQVRPAGHITNHDCVLSWLWDLIKQRACCADPQGDFQQCAGLHKRRRSALALSGLSPPHAYGLPINVPSPGICGPSGNTEIAYRGSYWSLPPFLTPRPPNLSSMNSLQKRLLEPERCSPPMPRDHVQVPRRKYESDLFPQG